MIDGASNPIHTHAPSAPAVLAVIRPLPTVRPTTDACLDEVILSDPCRTKALFDCPPEPIPFATYLEQLNRAKRIGDAAESCDPLTQPPPEKPRPDAPHADAEPAHRAPAVGPNPSPKLGDLPPAAAPPSQERPAPPVQPPPARSPTGRILDLFA